MVLDSCGVIAQVPSMATGRKPNTRRSASLANIGRIDARTAIQMPWHVAAGNFPRACEKALADGRTGWPEEVPKIASIVRITSTYDWDFFTAHKVIKLKKVERAVNMRLR